MSKNKRNKLSVTVSGQVSYIQVPSDQSEALMKYLRSRGVITASPEMCFGNTDSIALQKGTDAKAVQVLLDAWG